MYIIIYVYIYTHIYTYIYTRIYIYRYLQIGWHRILRLFVISFNVVPGVPGFSRDVLLAPHYSSVLIVNLMGRIPVRWKRLRNNFKILRHPICNWLYVYMYICTYINIYIYMHVCIHIYVYIYTHIYPRWAACAIIFPFFFWVFSVWLSTCVCLPYKYGGRKSYGLFSYVRLNCSPQFFPLHVCLGHVCLWHTCVSLTCAVEEAALDSLHMGWLWLVGSIKS